MKIKLIKMNIPELIKYESPGGPYWYHPDHPLCQDGKVLWEPMKECESCGEIKGPCPHCDGTGFVED